MLAALFVAADFLFAAAAGRRDAERRRTPVLRALDFFRPDERVRPRAAAPVVRFLLELRRDDFLAAAMVQLRGKNVSIDNSRRLYSNFRAQNTRLVNSRMFRRAGAPLAVFQVASQLSTWRVTDEAARQAAHQ